MRIVSAVRTPAATNLMPILLNGLGLAQSERTGSREEGLNQAGPLSIDLSGGTLQVGQAAERSTGVRSLDAACYSGDSEWPAIGDTWRAMSGSSANVILSIRLEIQAIDFEPLILTYLHLCTRVRVGRVT